MTRRKIILVSVVFFSIAVFTVQTLPQARSSNRTAKPPDAERLRNMTDEERKRELAKRRRQRKLERAQKIKELAKVGRGRLLDFEQRQKEAAERRKEFLTEKSLLGATEEQWKLIKAKLEKVKKVRQLREQARSTVGLTLTSSSSSGAKTRDSRSRSVPTWKWNKRWKDKAPAELTEAQKIANELIDLLENKNTRTEEFKEKMDALRKSRIKQRELNRQLSKARQELREVLTPRQEAALELWIYGWLL